MSGDGTDRGGAGAPDDSADGTDWLLSQLDEDETGAIETQPNADGPDDAAGSMPVTPQQFTPESSGSGPATPPAWTPASDVTADDDDRTRVLPVVPEPVTEAQPEPIATPPAAPATPPAPGHPGEFATEAELLAWWQSQVRADDAASATPAPAAPAPAAPTAPVETTPPVEPTAAETPTPAPRLHPNALQLPIVPPTPAPAAPVPPVLNELTVDTDSVLQHAPAGTFRPAPTNPVVLPPVDDEPWSLGTDDDDVPSAPEDVATAALPIAGALAAGDAAAWAAVDAEHPAPSAPTAPTPPPVATPAATPTSTPAATAAAPTAPGAETSEPTTAPSAERTGVPAGDASTDNADTTDDDLPDGSWSLSETFGDDVLDGEIVEVREPDSQTSDPVDLPAAASDTVPATAAGDVPASAPRTDPLEWLTVPFGQTFGATTTTADATTPDAPSADTIAPEAEVSAPAAERAVDDVSAPVESPVDSPPADIDTTPIATAVLHPEPSPEPDDAENDPTVEGSVSEVAAVDRPAVERPAVETADADTAPDTDDPTTPTPKTPLRWDSPAPTTPAQASSPASPADVPWPEPAASSEGEPLDETRPFDSLGGPGLLPAAAAAAAVVPPLSSVPEPQVGAIDDADTGADSTPVPPAFGPPTTPAERSITELISLDGVQPEPVVSPFGEGPFVWDLAPNDALDPLVHAAPTTQPIAVPAVQWEAAEPAAAVSDDSPSELALEGEVPDAAFIAGDLQPFAPGLAAETLGRPLVDGPGDELGSWTDDSDDDAVATTGGTTLPTPAAANDTVDLFPTLSLGGLDASLDAAAIGGLTAGAGVAAGAAGAGLAGPGAGGSEDAEDADGEAETASAADESSPTVESPVFAVDPEELDDEFDEEVVQFDAIPLSAAGVAPLPSFVPDDASPVEAPLPTPDADPVRAAEPEPVSEELRLESLFDLGPDTDLVDVVPAATAETSEQPEDTETPVDPSTAVAPPFADAPSASAAPVSDAADSPADEVAVDPTPEETSTVATGTGSSLADAFAAEGGWSLDADAAEAPDLPIAPVPGLIAGDGSAASAAPLVQDEEPPTITAPVPVVPESEAGVEAEGLAYEPATPSRGDGAAPVTPAFGSVVGTPAVAIPSQGPVVPAAQTAPAALPGETVAFPELDASGALGQAAPSAGVLGASLPPQAAQVTPDRDLPEYRGDRADQSIPKALVWAVVGLGAAVLLLLAFYFGTLVGAGNAGAIGTDTSPSPTAASTVFDAGEPAVGSA